MEELQNVKYPLLIHFYLDNQGVNFLAELPPKILDIICLLLYAAFLSLLNFV